MFWLILINCLYSNFKWLVIFLFLAPNRTCRVHRPRCIYIAFLNFELVYVINWIVIFFILLVDWNFHALTESANSFYTLLLFKSRRCILVSDNFFLGNEKGFGTLCFTVFILTILLYVFNDVLNWVILEHFIEILTI